MEEWRIVDGQKLMIKLPKMNEVKLIKTKKLGETSYAKQRASKKYVQKCQNETIPTARSRKDVWDPVDLCILETYAKTRTARHIALMLERTYEGVITKACAEGIELMTEDKQHGRLVTIPKKNN